MKHSKLTSLILAIALIATTVSVASEPQVVGKPSQAEIERKIDALLARMTLEEKLGQLQQLDGHADGNFRPEHLDLVRKGQLGSFLNVRGVKNTNTVQRVAVEESRLKIPALFGFDVIHGYRTIFPIPLGESSSWDRQAVERAASIAAKESRAAGVHWTFAPMVDIARDPRWGRIAEGAGEDPFLGAALARARVSGRRLQRAGQSCRLCQTLGCLRRGGSGTRLQHDGHVGDDLARNLLSAVQGRS